jgi:hypothetical protein
MRETMPIVSAPVRLTPKSAFLFCAFSCLPARGRLLGSRLSSPLGGRGRGSGSARLPGGGLGLAPLASGGGGEAGGSSLPITGTGLEAGLDGNRALLLNAGELLLLDLLLGLSLGVAV